MIPLKILIVDGTPKQEIGGQIQAILKRQASYSSELIGTSIFALPGTSSVLPDLVIPITTSLGPQKEKAIARLCDRFMDALFLPVIDPTDLASPTEQLLQHSSDFLLIPVQDCEVLTRIARMFASRENLALKKEVSRSLNLEQLLGEAPAFVGVKRRIPQVARSENTVLLSGETGTGKEVVARALHYMSRRAGKPFLPVNCGAIPVDLFERELFGHQKGAYTGALTAQSGLIEEAESGTLFLDEIETLTLGAQVKLLRFLQDKTYHTLGSSKLRRADVWIIASTNIDLDFKIREGTFREDLFYRLAVITLMLPPLRERRSDIPMLAEYFLKRYASHEDARKIFSQRAMEALCQYHWPGNVRELENVVRHLIAISESKTIDAEELPIVIPQTLLSPRRESLREMKSRVIQELEKTYISELLELYNRNVTHAARAAKKERRAFGRLIKKYNL